MRSRERVLLALNHREADRIPLFAPNVMDTREPYDERVRAFLDEFPFDRLAHVGGVIGHPSEKREMSPDMFVDGYGCRYEYRGVGLPYCVHSPLADAETVADVEAFDWPDPDAPDLIAVDARERATPSTSRASLSPRWACRPFFTSITICEGLRTGCSTSG